MGLLSWLKGLLSSDAKRDVSGLGGSDVDLVSETVRLVDGPLKPGHRRLILRDVRLVPKKRPAIRLRKRKKIFSGQQAGRLFSGSLRTSNRNIRDLLPDEQQLQRYGLPLWRTEEDVADALGITEGMLRFFASHRLADRVNHYVTFRVPKRRGGERIIMAPHKRLKALQRRLLPLLMEKLPVSPDAHGFLRGRSVRTGAEPHVGKAVVVRMDIRDFFPSVTYRRVRGFLIALGYGYPVAAVLALLMTESVRQPVETEDGMRYVPVGPRHCVQGAPTSPGLCNALVLKMDRRLAGLARKHGLAYTRYADDLTFSGNDPGVVPRLVRTVTAVVADEGFAIAADKTWVARRGSHQQVTGVTVNDVVGLSRQQRRRIRAMLHQQQRDNGTLDRVAIGTLAWVHMLNPQQAARLRERTRPS